MTEQQLAATHQALEGMEEAARLLGATQAKKQFGCYTQTDSRFETALHESIAKHKATIRTAIEQAETAHGKEPVMRRTTREEKIVNPGVYEVPVQEPYTYSSKQATMCACCGERKHTPLRIDAMGGYVCLTCIDQKLGSLLGEFGYSDTAAQPALKPLTDEQIGKFRSGYQSGCIGSFVELVRAIEAAHGIKEKNT